MSNNDFLSYESWLKVIELARKLGITPDELINVMIKQSGVGR